MRSEKRRKWKTKMFCGVWMNKRGGKKTMKTENEKQKSLYMYSSWSFSGVRLLSRRNLLGGTEMLVRTLWKVAVWKLWLRKLYRSFGLEGRELGLGTAVLGKYAAGDGAGGGGNGCTRLCRIRFITSFPIRWALWRTNTQKKLGYSCSSCSIITLIRFFLSGKIVSYSTRFRGEHSPTSEVISCFYSRYLCHSPSPAATFNAKVPNFFLAFLRLRVSTFFPRSAARIVIHSVWLHRFGVH